jgi:hypothetical protein
MTQPDGVALGIEEGFHILGIQAWHLDGIGDAALDVLIDGQVQLVHELRLGEEDEVVVFREVLEKEAQLPETLDIHEMGVVNDGGEHLTLLIDLPGGFDEEFLAGGIPAEGLDLESLAEDMQGIGVSVQGAGNGRCDHALGVMRDQRVLDNAFTGARFAHDDAKAALLAVDFKRLENLLLVWQQYRFARGVEGIELEAEV